jgi:hypothetical protein
MDSSGLPEKVEDERRELPSGESALLQEMIQAQFHSDTGFEYYDEQGISEDEMIKSEYMKYPEENGRTYHAYKAGKYMFPNDESEQDRLDLQHHLFLLTFDSKLYLSPIIRTKKHIACLMLVAVPASGQFILLVSTLKQNSLGSISVLSNQNGFHQISDLKLMILKIIGPSNTSLTLSIVA